MKQYILNQGFIGYLKHKWKKEVLEFDTITYDDDENLIRLKFMRGLLYEG